MSDDATNLAIAWQAAFDWKRKFEQAEAERDAALELLREVWDSPNLRRIWWMEVGELLSSKEPAK